MTHRYLTHFSTIFLIHAALLFCGLSIIENESVARNIGQRILNLKVASEVLLGGPKPQPRIQSRSKTSAVPVPAVAQNSAPQEEVKPGSIPSVGDASLSGTATADLKAIFKAELRARIDENKFYPAVARRMGHAGTVVVAFTMLEDGSIINVRIDSTSGNSQLDTAGIEAVKKVGKFKAIPDEFGTKSMDLSIPIKFQTI